MNNNLNVEEIREFYCWVRDYWEKLSAAADGTLSHVLNFGVWERDTPNLYAAQENFRQIIVALLDNVSSDSHCLEIGCGIGGFAVKTAMDIKGRLHCLDLLSEHLELSASYANEMNIAEKMTFYQGSAMQMSSFVDNSFDCAYCIESSFHYTDKEKFFQEVYRILKPGGIFVIADITCEDNNKITFKQGNFFPSSDEFIQYFNSAGFIRNKYRSVGSQVFAPLLNFVRTYNQKNKLRDKSTKFWERVLTNYSELCRAGLLDYKIYQLKK